MTLESKVRALHLSMRAHSGSFPFEWARRQFPVRIAFASTVNKSQGQTLSKVAVWLRNPVFTHGQLYVACSRTRNPTALKIAMKQQEGQLPEHTDNVVFRDVLIPN
uniref:ATP-dependent DNA helicase n=1 Tax=Octopus bimaculoides TaxID=37653 RepID=A0A0L8HZ67_OCTBM